MEVVRDLPAYLQSCAFALMLRSILPVGVLLDGLSCHVHKLLTFCYCRWIPDELGVPSFAQLCDLKAVPVADFKAAFDIWQIDAALSQGCGGPELPEEVML